MTLDEIDPIGIAVTYLKSQFPTTKVSPDLVGHSPGQAWIEVVQIDISRHVENAMDAADLAFYVYGPDKKSVSALSRQVRACLLNMRNQVVVGAYINNVEDGTGPADNADDTSNEQRFIYTACLYYTVI